jgi:hypothetical protein
MRDEDSFAGVVLFIVLGFGCLIIGGCTGRNDLRMEAVKAGVAEYRATPEGDVTFHWKEPAK